MAVVVNTCLVGSSCGNMQWRARLPASLLRRSQAVAVQLKHSQLTGATQHRAAAATPLYCQALPQHRSITNLITQRHSRSASCVLDAQLPMPSSSRPSVLGSGLPGAEDTVSAVSIASKLTDPFFCQGSAERFSGHSNLVLPCSPPGESCYTW